MSGSVHKISDLSGPDLRLGPLEVRLAETDEEIDAAQALRYRVFYEEMGAKPTWRMRQRHRDFDKYDKHCDHLLVIDHSRRDKHPVVGTYRLIRYEAAQRCGGFYSKREYNIKPILHYSKNILELGRSCIDAEYRTGPVMQILWRGLTAYVSRYNIELMFGCASLPGTKPKDLAIPLSYLYHFHLAPPGIRPKARLGRRVNMNILPRRAFDAGAAFNDIKLDPRSGINSLPPLIKGYLRVGGFVGDGAVIDRQFNTTDVFVIVKTDLIAARYKRHYELSGKKDNLLATE